MPRGGRRFEEGQDTKVTTTAPWGQKSEAHIGIEGINRGRIDRRVVKDVEVLNDDFEPSAEDLTPMTTPQDLTTHFSYADDGSGRITDFKLPDNSSVELDHREGGRLFEVLPSAMRRQGSLGTLSETFEYNCHDNLQTAVTDALNRKILTPPVTIDGGDVLPTTRRGYDTEHILTDALYKSTGVPEKIFVGASTAKAVGSQGLEEITLEYRENSAGGGEGYLESVVKGGGPVTRFDYDSFANPTSITRTSDSTTNTTRQFFDEWDRPYEIKIAAGAGDGTEKTISNKYDLSGRRLITTGSQKGIGPVTVTKTYNDHDQLTVLTRTKVASTGGETTTRNTSYDYDLSTGLMNTVTPPGGSLEAIHIERDGAGRPVKISYPAPNGQTEPTVIYKAYDKMGRLVYSTDGDRGWWKGSYNDLGQLVHEKLADGTSVAREYDAAGGLAKVSVTGSDGTTRKVEYHVSSFGAVTKFRELNLNVDGQPTTRVSNTVYDFAGRVTKLSRGGRDEKTIHYKDGDKSGRIESMTDAFGNRTSFTYKGKDPWPQSITTKEAGSNVVTGVGYTYDQRGRITHLTTSAGYSEHRSYDESGNLLEVYNDGPYSRLIDYSYDGWGRLQKILVPGADQGGRTTHFDYDEDGRVVKQILSRRIGEEISEFEYDLQGNLKTRTLPGAPMEEFFYDPDGRLARQKTRISNEQSLQLELSHSYDPMNRPQEVKISNLENFVLGGLPTGLAPVATYGDSFTYDDLGRMLRHARLIDAGGEPNSRDEASLIAYTYADLDPRPLPKTEKVGGLGQLWPDASDIARNWDIFDRMEDLTAPGLQYTFGYDSLDRRHLIRTGNESPSATYLWGGASRYFGFDSGAVSQRFGYKPTGPLESLGSSYQTTATTDEAQSQGTFSFDWTHSSRVKEGRLVDDESSLLADMGWDWGVDTVMRLTSANNGGREWTFDLGRADEMIALTTPEGDTFTFGEGVNGRIESILSHTAEGPGTEMLAYDALGNRISDSRQDYLWNWRGELEKTTTSADHHEIDDAYDADGRLLSRTDKNEAGDFLNKRAFIWNGWELLSQVGLNFQDEVIWRVEHLPGPVGMDDSPQLKVTTHMHSSDREPETTRIYDVVRDEMGSVVAIFEDLPAPPEGETILPPLKARYFYDPYGQAHVELGPELRSIKHDAERTTVDGVNQAPLDEGEDDNPVTGIAGSLVIKTSIELDEATLSTGILLERWEEADQQFVAMSAGDVEIAPHEGDGRSVDLMPVEGWLEANRYRVVLSDALKDGYGRSFTPPEGGEGVDYPISVPEDVLDTDEDLDGMPVEVPVVFDTIKAASEGLECTNSSGEPEACFPGGMNLLFQGLWTDPTTGLSYARNRWYDARTASWLSEDPAGAVDSPNLYAFVGWAPHMGTDPMGLAVGADAYVRTMQAIADANGTDIDTMNRQTAVYVLAALGQVRGYSEAARNLRFYLDEDNPGSRLVDLEWLQSFPEVRDAIDIGEAELRNQLAGRVVAHGPGVGDSISTSSKVRPTSYSDLYWASGTSTIEMKMANIEIHRNGETIVAQGEIYFYWSDPYNWDQGKFVQPAKDIPVLRNTPLRNWRLEDKEIGILEEEGVAKNFLLEALWSKKIEFSLTSEEWEQFLPNSSEMTQEEIQALIESSNEIITVTSTPKEDGR